MSNICLSPTPNLRCQTLSTIESIVLLIPPGLEVVFGIGLILYKRGSRNKLHYFLSGEGLIYCALAFGDLIAHLAPRIKNSLNAFKAFDITIGVLSSLPILLFTAYLFLFSARDLVPTLPRRAQSVSKYTILLFIPVVLVFNELGSFLTLTYRLFAGDTIAVKFNNDGLRTFFNTMAILFLTMFQAGCFCMCFYRLTRALVDQKRIDVSNKNSQEAHLLNGIVWTTIGIKLGAIESVIGFAPSIFGLSLTRRILRFLGRACLAIGVMQGLDTVEDFSMLDIRQRMRRSRLLPFISDPVDSSFHQIGGYAYEASYEAPPAVARSRSISMDSRIRYDSQEKPLSQTARGTTVPWPTKGSPIGSQKLFMPGIASEKTKKRSFDSISTTRSVQKPNTPSLTVDTHNISFAGERRVLVRYQHGRAPTLEMKRLSGLLQSIPSPLTSEGTQSIASATPLASPEDPHATRSALIPLPTAFTEDAPQSYETAFTDSPLVGIGLPDRRRIRPEVRRTLAGTATAAARRSSAIFPLHQSVGGPLRGSDAQLAGLHALAMQSTSTVATTFAETYGTTLGGASVARSASSRTVNSRSGLIRRSSSVKRKPVPQWDNLDSAIAKLEAVSAVETTFEPVSNDGSISPLEQNLKNLPISAPSHRTEFDDRKQGRRAKSLAARRPQMSFVTQGPRSLSSPATTVSATSSRGGFPWMPDTAEIAADGYAELDEAWARMGLKRIKSIGSAPHKRTPIPSQSTFSRGSMAAQWDDDMDIAEIMSSSV